MPFPAQSHRKTCAALEREEEARREADRQMGAQLAVLTERLTALGVASPAAAVPREHEAGQVCHLRGRGNTAVRTRHPCD